MRNVFKNKFFKYGILILLIITNVYVINSCKVANIKLITADELLNLINDSVKVNEIVLIDTRARMAYIRGHLVSSIWVNFDSLESKQFNISIQTPVIIYDSTQSSSVKALKVMRKKGFTNVTALRGGYGAWAKKSYPSAIQLVQNTNPTLDIKHKDITIDEVYNIVTKKDKRYAIIDVRSYLAYKEGHVESAISIPYAPINEFVVQMEELNFAKNKPLIIYCVGHTCDSGEKAIDVLLRNGYTEVYLFGDGIEGWMSKGYPIVKN